MPVLILIVVEDGLVLVDNDEQAEVTLVLILVVVEDGLVLSKWLMGDPVFVVLILVVVEDGLVPFVLLSKESKEEGLNPCCSGRWSRTLLTNLKQLRL